MKLIRRINEELKPTNTETTGFHINIENETTKNKDYRRVLYTTDQSQLVVMSIQPGDEIGEEVHNATQFIRVDAGNGKSIINGNKREFVDGDAIVVPAGANHNIINTGDKPLQLYTVYSPPQHKKDTVHKTKADDNDDHFNGKKDK
jgi:mannose-6-phosphate isomerase-like protein (cupin superfamily)